MSKRSKLGVLFVGLVLLVGGCTYFISNSENDSVDAVESVSAVEPVSSVSEAILSSLAEAPNNLISEDTDSTDYVTDNTDEKGRPVVEYTQGDDTSGGDLELVVDPVTGDIVLNGDISSSLPATPPASSVPEKVTPPASSAPEKVTPPASSAPADPSKGGDLSKWENMPGVEIGSGELVKDHETGKDFDPNDQGNGGYH